MDPEKSRAVGCDDGVTAVVSEPASAEVSTPQTPNGGRPPGSGPAATGSSLGRYVVLGELGVGGMGRVLRAYDPKLQREVALKEVRTDLLDEKGSARLVAEARAMAKLSHPNVVAVYDVEDLGGDHRWGVVMEYVPGVTLRAWLEQEQHDWRDVVGRFVDAGRGLAAAHAAGLLHRDFKPANVLVTQSSRAKRVGGSMDGDTVKVTDFGLAKLASAPETSSLRAGPFGSLWSSTGPSSVTATRSGTVLGTPRYMAPEQHRGDPLTPAADQYAFCVSLWLALAGEPPFCQRPLVDAKLVGPPAWPVAAVPRHIGEAIRRGLAPDPEQRWPTLEALLDQLVADPAARRRRWFWTTIGLGIAGGLVMVGSSWAAARADRCTGAAQQLVGVWDAARREEVRTAIAGIEASYAQSVWHRVAERVDGYATDWTAMHTEACEATTLRGEQSTAVMDLRMACLHRTRAELGAVTRLLADADADVVSKTDEVVGALPPLSRCADVEALQAEVEPPSPNDADDVGHIRDLLATVSAQRHAGRYAAAHSAVAEAKALLETVDYAPVRAETALAEGYVLEHLGQYEASEVALTEALTQAAQWRQWEVLQEAASTLILVVGDRRQQLEPALRYRALAQGLAAGDPLREASVHNNLALVLWSQGKFEAAEAEDRQALALRLKVLGPTHVDVATSRGNLALALSKQGKLAEAEAEHRRALAAQDKALGGDHPDVAGQRLNIAGLLYAQGEYEEAESETRRALALLQEALGPGHPRVPQARNNLAKLLNAQGKTAEAEAEFRQALALLERTFGAQHTHVATTRGNLANALFLGGNYAKAEAEYRQALAVQVEAKGADHPRTTMVRINLASTLREQGKLAEAEVEFREVLRLRQQTLAEDHPRIAYCQAELADVLLERGQADEAIPLAEQALPRLHRPDVPPAERASAAFVLARALWTTASGPQQRARAIELGQRALEAYAAAGPLYADAAAKVGAWLGEHGG